MSNGPVTGAGSTPPPGQTPRPGWTAADPGASGPDEKAAPGEEAAPGEIIEATTGVPLALLPQRAPRVAVPFAGSGGSGRTLATRPPDAPVGPDSGTDIDPPAAPDDEEDFWLPIEEVHWDGTPLAPTPRRWFGRFRRSPAEPGQRRPPRPPKPQRHPAVGLAGSIALTLVASFFAWVSAEPMWLAFGHGQRGAATVTACTGSGLGQQCRGEFAPADGSYTAWDIRLAGIGADERAAGSRVPARMVGPHGSTAYAGTGTGPLHLRWSLGLVMILLCGAGIGWASGALRLPDRRSRRGASLLSLAGPLLIAAAFLVAAR